MISLGKASEATKGIICHIIVDTNPDLPCVFAIII